MADEVMTTSATGGSKGTKLARFDCIPAEALQALAEHYGQGAKKYGDHNWRKGYEWSKSFAAMQRHAWAWWGGEETDEETGSSHMMAVAFHAFSLFCWATDPNNRQKFDDRYTDDPMGLREAIVLAAAENAEFVQECVAEERAARDAAELAEDARWERLGVHLSNRESDRKDLPA